MVLGVPILKHFRVVRTSVGCILHCPIIKMSDRTLKDDAVVLWTPSRNYQKHQLNL